MTQTRRLRPLVLAQEAVAAEPGIDLDLAQALTNRVSWIALMLTPLADTQADHGDEIADVVADLDGLIRDLRLAAVGTDGLEGDPLEAVRRVLHDVQARLGACWAAHLDGDPDQLDSNRLAQASHLVRGALISLQQGSVR